MDQKKIKLILGFFAVLLLSLSAQSASFAKPRESKALPPLKIVHLGDSYSAGNGARSAKGDRNYYGVKGCYRSPTNWGSQFAESLKDTFAVTYINRACSGGVTYNITSPRVIDYPKKNFIDGSCPRPDYPDEESIEIDKDDPSRCKRTLNAQIDAVDSSVDLVIMTMGGNDVQFDRIVMQCFVPFYRDPAGCRYIVEQASKDLDGVDERQYDIFLSLRGKLRPDAKVVFVTYPYLATNVDYRLENILTNDTYVAAQEVRALGLEGDEHQRNAVNRANVNAGEDFIVLYDGTKALFDGHEPNPFFSEENPDRWLHEFVAYPSSDSYHPNPLGHENWGRALSAFETFGATNNGSFGKDADVDIAFVVDTTGSMGDEIAQVRADLSKLVDKLASTTSSYRVAVVSYRDFPERTGDSNDYPYRVDQTFTNDLGLIQAAIDSLSAESGGDDPETVFSGIQATLELPWRPGVTKTMIVLGDAPALSPEPITNLTASQIVANSIAVDPVQVIGVNVGNLDSNGELGLIAGRTGGSVISGTSALTDTILEIFDATAKQPFAWVGQAYSGKIGEPIQFDASGSYDPSGFPISRYEWDFDGDGIFDLDTTEPSATHIYDMDFNDFVVLRVTSPGGTALASARAVVNSEGFASQGDEESCELDKNGYSIIVDESGIFIPCTADHLPEKDQEGVREVSGGASSSGGAIAVPFVILIVLGGAVWIYSFKAQKSHKKLPIYAYLQLVNDPNRAGTIPLKMEFNIGRGTGSDLRLTDTTVSRRHACIRYAQGAWYIQDKGSASGTFINGQRVQAKRLNDGDQITIGKSTFIFRI